MTDQPMTPSGSRWRSEPEPTREAETAADTDSLGSPGQGERQAFSSANLHQERQLSSGDAAGRGFGNGTGQPPLNFNGNRSSSGEAESSTGHGAGVTEDRT